MRGKITIRRARRDEARVLTALALRSKAHWGYPAKWLELWRLWRPELTVTSLEIADHPTFVAEEDSSILGFYLLKPSARVNAVELDFLFVEPSSIGCDVGKVLFEHARTTAKALGYSSMIWGSDPNADGFYLKMGAKKVGERVSSSIPGRANAEMEIAL